MLEVDWEIRPATDGTFFVVDSNEGIIAVCSSKDDAEKIMVIPELVTALVDAVEIGSMGLEIAERELDGLDDSEVEHGFVSECLRKIREIETNITDALAGEQ
jgi:hypothetical protein